MSKEGSDAKVRTKSTPYRGVKIVGAVLIGLLGAHLADAQLRFTLPASGLMIDNRDSRVIYASTHAGVFKTLDSGRHWQPANFGLTNPARIGDRSVGALAMNPQDPGILYAGTVRNGLFKSVDGGNTWSRLDMGLRNPTISALAIDPSNTQVVYAGSDGDGVLKSDDSGKTWKRANFGLTDQRIGALIIDPWSGQIYAGTSSGVFRSRDGADTWNPANRGLRGRGGHLLVTDGQASGNLYTGTQEGLFKSSDGGETWVNIHAGLVAALAVAPDNPNLLYAGIHQQGLVRSSDSGDTWTQLLTIPDTVIHSVVIDSRDTKTLYLGTDRGVFKTTDGGQTWNESSSGLTLLARSDILAIEFDPSNDLTVFASLGSLGVWKSTDGGGTWSPAIFGLEDKLVLDLAIGGTDAIYAATTKGLFKSANQGEDWTFLRTDLGDESSTAFFKLAISPANPRILYAIGRVDNLTTILKSTNAGERGSWAITVPGFRGGQLNDVTVDPNDSSIFYIGTQGGVVKSSDGGQSWLFSRIVQSPFVLAVAVDPSATSTVYVATNDGGVSKSVDGGMTWVSRNSGLPITETYWSRVLTLAIDPFASGVVYAGLAPGSSLAGADIAGEIRGGVFKTADGGTTWVPFNSGLGNDAVSSLAVRRDGTVFAGTQGNGIFRRSSSSGRWESTAEIVAPVYTEGAVVNAASFLRGSIARGEIVTIFGSGLGPEVGQSGVLNPNTGRLATTVAGVTVAFEGIPAPIFFVSEGQVNLQVPYEIEGRATASPSTLMLVRNTGRTGLTVRLFVAESAPAIFTLSGGTGPGAILNQDFTLNGASNPAAIESTIQIFATGQGETAPPERTGGLSEPPFAVPVLPVRLIIGDRLAETRFVGLAPGFAGVLQINAVVPSGATVGSAVPILLMIGSAQSQPGVTMAIRE